jgi:hypothetical protein
MIVNGNERVLFIKRGDNFQPVGCLTSNGMDEDTEMLPTTTRNSEGWRTSIPQIQGFTINFEGLQVPTIFQPNNDVIYFSTMLITILNNSYNYSLRFRIVRSDGWFLYIQKGITNDSAVVSANPAGNVLRGATIAETVENIVDNLTTYNATAQVTFNNDDDKINVVLTESGAYDVTQFLILVSEDAPTIATYILDTVEVENPNQLVSYDRLRQIKRNREKITWRIFSPEIGTQFIDEGEGYIANISESSPVNNDASFSGSIIGWGVPRVLLLNVAIGTNGEFITDGEDNIISP